jgi:hypothetical protein
MPGKQQDIPENTINNNIILLMMSFISNLQRGRII